MVKYLKHHEIRFVGRTGWGDVWESSIEYNGRYYFERQTFMGYTKSEIKSIFRKMWLEKLGERR